MFNFENHVRVICELKNREFSIAINRGQFTLRTSTAWYNLDIECSDHPIILHEFVEKEADPELDVEERFV